MRRRAPGGNPVLITPFESFPSCFFKNQNGFLQNLLDFRRSKFRVSVFFEFLFSGFFGIWVSVFVWSWWFWFCMVLWSPFPGAVFRFR